MNAILPQSLASYLNIASIVSDIQMYPFFTSFSSHVDLYLERLLLWLWDINFQCWRCFWSWSWFWFWWFRKRHKPSPEALSLPSMSQQTSGVVRILNFESKYFWRLFWGNFQSDLISLSFPLLGAHRSSLRAVSLTQCSALCLMVGASKYSSSILSSKKIFIWYFVHQADTHLISCPFKQIFI